MKGSSLIKGWQRKHEKRERKKEKVEGHAVRPTFPAFVLIILLVAGSLLTALNLNLWMLLFLLPIFARNYVKWNFLLSVELGVMIAVVILITNLLIGMGDIEIYHWVAGFALQAALFSLLIYLGVFIVNTFYEIKSKG
ncbi:MAG: hypothetical protein ACXQTP_05925 [Candidatus Methanofastidiosia archaeon]